MTAIRDAADAQSWTCTTVTLATAGLRGSRARTLVRSTACEYDSGAPLAGVGTDDNPFIGRAAGLETTGQQSPTDTPKGGERIIVAASGDGTMFATCLLGVRGRSRRRLGDCALAKPTVLARTGRSWRADIRGLLRVLDVVCAARTVRGRACYWMRVREDNGASKTLTIFDASTATRISLHTPSSCRFVLFVEVSFIVSADNTSELVEASI